MVNVMDHYLKLNGDTQIKVMDLCITELINVMDQFFHNK